MRHHRQVSLTIKRIADSSVVDSSARGGWSPIVSTKSGVGPDAVRHELSYVTLSAGGHLPRGSVPMPAGERCFGRPLRFGRLRRVW
jgi:hypothetical protein